MDFNCDIIRYRAENFEKMIAQLNGNARCGQIKRVSIWLVFFLFPPFLFSQQNTIDTIFQNATIDNCIHYALENNPDLKNAKINEDITEATIKSKLADWYPQINFNYSLQHYFKLPTTFFNGNIVRSGSENTSALQFGATQNIFNRDVLLASRSAKDVRIFAIQNTREQKITIAVLVSKAFYDLMLTMQQLKVSEADIIRIEQSYKDAYYQYQSGIVDKTDYKQASISLNNAKAQKKSITESLKVKYAYLKELMGYPFSKEIQLMYDTTQMENEILIDTSQNINFNNRIEIQMLQTQKKLQQYNLQYYKWAFLPDVSAYGNYNLNYLNNQFSKLYNLSYPNSYAGILFSIPIFQGGKRSQQIKLAQFQIAQVDNSIHSIQDSINTQYQQALASYKSNLYDYNILKENLEMANEVYEVIQLQYRSGVKTYLDVINAETVLRTAQINYYNALYEVLSSKIDVARALGNINY